MTEAAAIRAQDTSFALRLLNASRRHRSCRDAFELALVALAFLLYFTVRALVVERSGEALANAHHVIDFERWMGIYWEPRLQEVVVNRHGLVQLFNFIYFWLDFPLIVVFGLWLYFFKRHEYTVARDALL